MPDSCGMGSTAATCSTKLWRDFCFVEMREPVEELARYGGACAEGAASASASGAGAGTGASSSPGNMPLEPCRFRSPNAEPRLSMRRLLDELWLEIRLGGLSEILDGVLGADSSPFRGVPSPGSVLVPSFSLTCSTLEPPEEPMVTAVTGVLFVALSSEMDAIGGGMGSSSKSSSPS